MKSVLFDFGGTLDADGTSWIDRFHPLYKEAGIDVPRKDFEKAFHASDDGLASRYPLKGLSLEETLDRQVGCVLESLAPGRLRLRRRLVSRFLSDCRRHFQRNRPVLERLSRRYRLGIVSNFYGNLESVLASEGLLGLFEAVADSGVVGSEKPAPGLFLHAIRALGVRPSECVMIGDSIPRDMRGAEGLSMSHGLLASSPDRRCCPDAWTLRALPELEPLLA